MTPRSPLLTSSRAATLSILAVLALAAPALADTTPTDAWITTKVKISLATSEGVRASDVNVDTVDRQVTLHGTVTTAEAKDSAAQTAKSIRGANGVRNLLQVVPAKDEEAVEAKDEEVSARVSAALAADESLKDSKISVQSVNKGVVLLGGNATTLSDHLTAVEVAAQEKGVRRVASEIQSDDALADKDAWKERNIAVAEGASSGGTRDAANDLFITSMVKMRLLANADTPAMDINVDTRRGVVTLFGMVPSEESRTAAAKEAGSTGGVASVKNQLQVVATAKQPAIEAKDDVVQSAVKKNLETHVDLGHVSSEVKNCVVRLSGTVSSGTDRVEAMQVARATNGVCSVSQDLTIQ